MFQYEIENIHGYEVFRLIGRVDVISAEKLEVKFKDLVENKNRKNIILDFSAVTYFSSTGMRVIIALKNKLDDLGGKLKIIRINRMVEKILKAIDLLDKYEVYEDLEQAVQS